METTSPPSFRPGSGSRRAARRSAVFAPLYRQIKDLLVESLRRGEWMPGAAIPSETELANRFQVSQGTVRKAIDELASENLLVRRQGKGTFVPPTAAFCSAAANGRARTSRHASDCVRARL